MRISACLVLLLAATVVCGQSSVVVNSGSGDGRYRGQQRVDVWADPYPAGQIFDKWIGDTHLLARDDEWHAKLRTGTRSIELTATYRQAPAWVAQGPEAVGSSQMRYFFPANPVGVVFHFHGSGGSMNGLFSQPEQIVYARELVAAGYAVVTLNSSDRVNAQWNTAAPPNNPDIANVQTAIAGFISRGLMTGQTPVFASGISNGGAFAPRVSLFLGFRGTAIYVATSNATIMQNTNSATIWNIMRNDTTLAPGSVEEAFNNYTILRGRGIRAEYNVLEPSAVFPERFRRIPGLNPNDSVTIYGALKSNGFLDRRDLLIQNPNVSGWVSAIPAQYTANLPDISDQLQICYTEHQFFSDHNRRTIRFFDSLRATPGLRVTIQSAIAARPAVVTQIGANATADSIRTSGSRLLERAERATYRQRHVERSGTWCVGPGLGRSVRSTRLLPKRTGDACSARSLIYWKSHTRLGRAFAWRYRDGACSAR